MQRRRSTLRAIAYLAELIDFLFVHYLRPSQKRSAWHSRPIQSAAYAGPTAKAGITFWSPTSSLTALKPDWRENPSGAFLIPRAASQSSHSQLVQS